MRFTTENGTVYEIDATAKKWHRISRTEKSGITRSEGGNLIEIPIVKIGWPVYMQDDNVRPGCNVHFVQTSPVVSIDEQGSWGELGGDGLAATSTEKGS